MKNYNFGGGNEETTKRVLDILRMSTRDELKIKLRNWMKSVIRITADPDITPAHTSFGVRHLDFSDAKHFTVIVDDSITYANASASSS